MLSDWRSGAGGDELSHALGPHAHLGAGGKGLSQGHVAPHGRLGTAPARHSNTWAEGCETCEGGAGKGGKEVIFSMVGWGWMLGVGEDDG